MIPMSLYLILAPSRTFTNLMCNSHSLVPKVNNVEGTVESILAFKPQYLFDKFLPF
jgi:hypothetical protein